MKKTDVGGKAEGINGSKVPIEGRCGAKIRKSDPPRYCVRYPLNGKTRCRLHGGKSLGGIASPTYKHGRASKIAKSLPARYMEAFNESINDPEWLSLKPNIAALDARIDELYADLDKSQSSQEIWKELKKNWTNFLYANKIKDEEGRNKAVVRLNELITNGDANSSIWYEIMLTKKARKDLGDSELKRQQAHDQSITNEQALAFFYQMLTVIKTGVSLYIPDVEQSRPLLSYMSDNLRVLVQSNNE